MNNILYFIKNLINNPLIINSYNNFPFKEDTRLIINSKFNYTLKKKDYLLISDKILKTITNIYNEDNSLNLWKVTFTYILNGNKITISKYIYCISNDYLIHIGKYMLNNNNNNDNKITVDSNNLLIIDIINIPIDSNQYNSIFFSLL